MKPVTKITSLILSLALIFAALGCPALAASDGMVRIKLTKLGSRTEMSFKTNCAYAVSGGTIPSGTSLTIQVAGSSLSLTSGGKTLATGGEIKLKRGASGGAKGVTFTSPSYGSVYGGDLTFSIASGVIQPVLTCYIEDYVVGVVICEVGNSFPMEALKAQAIAARTYAMLLKKSSGSYDLVDNTNNQAYRGYNSSKTNVISAVEATKGVIAYYGGSLARLYYAASNGGQTETAKNAWGNSISYLVCKDDPYDYENPASIKKTYKIYRDYARNSFPQSVASAINEAVAGKLTNIGLSIDETGVIISSVDSIVLKTPKYAEPSRAYTKAAFTLTVQAGGRTGQVEIELATYALLEGALSLSINSGSNEIFEVVDNGDYFSLISRRFGHGVGMSQRGAQWMASQYGKSCQEIIEFYYPGVTLQRVDFTDSTQSFAGGSTVPDVGTDTEDKTQSTGVYATIRLSYASSKLNVRDKAGTGSSVIGTLGHGTRVEVLDVSGSWAKIKYSGRTGYVMAAYLAYEAVSPTSTPTALQTPAQTIAPTAAPSAGKVGVIRLSSSSGKLNVRSAASSSGRVLGTIAHGSSVEVLGVSGSWAKIAYKDGYGFVYKTYVVISDVEILPTPVQTPAPGATEVPRWGEATPAPTAAIATATPAPTSTPTETGTGVYAVVNISSSSSRLNVRDRASSSGKVIGGLKNGARVEVLSSDGAWTRIHVNGSVGYVSSAHLKPAEGANAPIATAAPAATETPASGGASADFAKFSAVVVISDPDDTLSLRKAASTSADMLAQIPNGGVVDVLDYNSSWAKVVYRGKTGFAARSCLERADKVYVAVEYLSAYDAAQFGGNVLGSINEGERLAVVATSGDWAKIHFAGDYAFVLLAGMKRE